jgi:hypothetical protein
MVVASALLARSHIITAGLRGAVTSPRQVEGNQNANIIANWHDRAKSQGETVDMTQIHQGELR